MWLRGCQTDIPGPVHPSAQNRCRHHLASGKGPLACGCVYGAASGPLMDMLPLDGSEATCSSAGWPWMWGTPESAPHVQCGHRLAPSGWEALTSVPMHRIWTQVLPLPPGELEGSITCYWSPSPRPHPQLPFPTLPYVPPGWLWQSGCSWMPNVPAVVGAQLIWENSAWGCAGGTLECFSCVARSSAHSC